MRSTVFSDNDRVDSISKTVNVSMQRVKAIASAFASGELGISQYKQAVKSLQSTVHSLDVVQDEVANSLQGSSNFSDVLEDDTTSNAILTNVALTRMSAILCAGAMQGDMEEDIGGMDLEEALNTPDAEVEVDPIEASEGEPIEPIETSTESGALPSEPIGDPEDGEDDIEDGEEEPEVDEKPTSEFSRLSPDIQASKVFKTLLKQGR